MCAKYRLLVVDDEEDLCDILKFNLENEGYDVDTAFSAEEALKLDLSNYHLLLLDVMMGEISGFRLAKMVRQCPKTKDLPIIFLTAKDTENDAVTGLTLGADDYISKPFSLRQVMLRVKAVLRRTAPQGDLPTTFVGFKALRLDLNRKEARLNDDLLPLTKTEFEMLRMLLENEGRVFSRAEILRRVWHNDVEVLDRTIDVNITRIRKKLGDYGRYIVTRMGYGYCFDTGVKD